MLWFGKLLNFKWLLKLWTWNRLINVMGGVRDGQVEEQGESADQELLSHRRLEGRDKTPWAEPTFPSATLLHKVSQPFSTKQYLSSPRDATTEIKVEHFVEEEALYRARSYTPTRTPAPHAATWKPGRHEGGCGEGLSSRGAVLAFGGVSRRRWWGNVF